MKKTLLAGLLAFLLAVSCAQAETRTQTYEIFEDSIDFTVTRYHSEEMLLSFWYDAEFLTVEDGMSESGNSVILYPADPEYSLPVHMEFILPEWDETHTLHYLETAPEAMELETLSSISLFMTEGGLAAAYRFGYANGLEYRFMALWNNAGHVNIFFQQPIGEYDDVLLRLDALLATVQFE